MTYANISTLYEYLTDSSYSTHGRLFLSHHLSSHQENKICWSSRPLYKSRPHGYGAKAIYVAFTLKYDIYNNIYTTTGASLLAKQVKSLSAMQEMQEKEVQLWSQLWNKY